MTSSTETVSQTTLPELESRLWDSANALRGPVDPADFKNYVFPMLASRSMISGSLALMSWLGACSPACNHAAWRPVARAVLIAANAVGASAARVVNSRDTGGVGGHRPEHAGLFPQEGEIGEAVPAERDGHRQIEQDLAGIMGGQRFAPR